MNIVKRAKSADGKTFLLAAGVGTVAAVVVFQIASRELDRQLARGGEGLIQAAEGQLRSSMQRQLQQQVPPMVRAEVVSKLSEYGITPQTGRRIDRALVAIERLGWI